MSQSTVGYKHSTLWSFGDWVYHKVTGDKGMIIGIHLREACQPQYLVVFDDSRKEDACVEFELTDKEPTAVAEV